MEVNGWMDVAKGDEERGGNNETDVRVCSTE